MPIQISEDLILVEAKQITIKDKETGEPIKKWAYKFLDKDNKLVKGFDENGFYVKEVQTVSGFTPEKAKPYTWELTEWEGVTKKKLVVGGIRKIK
jgi:hypothetical protein